MPPKAKLALLSSGGLQMSLRPGRAAVPGAPDKPRPKRSPLEMTIERLVKENEKLTKSAATASKIEKLAQLENKMHDDDAQLEQDANHPPANQQLKQPRKVIAKSKKKSAYRAFPVACQWNIHVCRFEAVVDTVPDSADEPTMGCDEDQAVEDEVNFGGGDDLEPGSEDEPSGSMDVDVDVDVVEAVEAEVTKKGKGKAKPTKIVKSHEKPVKPVKEKANAKVAEGLEDKKKEKMAFRQQVMEKRVDIKADKNSAAKRKHSESATETLYVSLPCGYAKGTNTPLTQSLFTMHPCVQASAAQEKREGRSS